MRTFRSNALVLSALILLTETAKLQSAERELLADPQFERGFRVLRNVAGKREPLGNLEILPGRRPSVWDIAQWGTNWEALPSKPQISESGALRWENPTKIITLERTGNRDSELTLTIRGTAEYGNTVRASAEPWPHLLVEQSIADAPCLASLAALKLRLDYRLVATQLNVPEAYDPSKHAAQFLLYLHISNTDRSSLEYGQYLHFGVPLYDNRHRLAPEHFAPDTGGTGMVIFAPAANEFTAKSSHDGEWITLDCDILPLIRRGLERAWSKGALTATRKLGAYRVTFITFGWELPGNFDAAIRIRGLQLTASEP